MATILWIVRKGPRYTQFVIQVKQISFEAAETSETQDPGENVFSIYVYVLSVMSSETRQL